MSLFGAMMGMGDVDDDPFFGGQIRRMNHMMNSMFRDPFADMFGGGMFGGPSLMLPAPPGHPQQQPHHYGRHARHGHQEDFGGAALTPFGTFPNLRQMFDMSNPAGGAQFSSMQVMTMTSGPDGRPQVYQATSTSRQGPNGVRETKKTVADSRTGLKKMAIGHHIHDRAHIIEREQNVYSGEQEERQEFINLEEEEADTFNKEWAEKTRGMRRNEAIGYGSGRPRHGRENRNNSDMLALPPAQTSSSSNNSSGRVPPRVTPRRSVQTASSEPKSNAAAIAENSSGRVPPRAMPRRSVQTASSEPKSKAAAIAENDGDERGTKRPLVVEIDSDSEEPNVKSVRRSADHEVTITEVTSDSDSDEEGPTSQQKN